MGKLKTSIIPKRYVFIQATEPTDKSEGKLWYNTTAKTTYASDGISYSKVANIDLSTVYKMIGNNALNIIDNTAQANLTAGTNANIIRDTYSVAGGFLGSIDDGTSWTGSTLNVSASTNYHYGIKFNLKQPNFLKSAIFSFGTTPAITWQIGTVTAGSSDIGSGTLNNGVANINIMLQPNIDYYLTCYNNGSTYDYNKIGVTYPLPIGDIGEITSDAHDLISSLKAVQSLEFSGTNATFTNGKYENSIYNNILSSGLPVLDTQSGSTTNKEGIMFNSPTDFYLMSFAVGGLSVVSNWYLGTTAKGSEIASGNLTNKSATVNISLQKNTNYYLTFNSGASYYTPAYTSNVNYPYTVGSVTIPSRDDGSLTLWNELLNIEISPSILNDAIAQTKNIKIDGTKKKAMIISTDEETTGSGSINYDISTDRGVNFIKNNLSGTEINLTNNGTNLILRQNLNVVGEEDTATAKDYAVVLY